MSSGTLFSPAGAVSATTAASISNSMVREAIMGVHVESAYMSGMVQSLGRTGGYYGSGMNSLYSHGMGSMYGRGASSMYGGMESGIQSMSRASRFYGGPSARIMGGGVSGTLAMSRTTFSEGIQAMKSGLKAQIGIGTAIGAVMSLFTNIHAFHTGQITKGDAAGNVATDTVSAGISATGAALLGGVATAALGAIGMAGLPLTLLGIGAGVLGGLVTDSLFRNSKLSTGIHDSVANAFAS